MFEVEYNGKIFTTNLKTTYKCYIQAIAIKKWIDESNCTQTQAAEKFNVSTSTVKARLVSLDQEPSTVASITLAMIKEGIEEHLKTGSINETIKKYGFSKGCFGARMRCEGYSLKDRAYFKVDKPSKISYQQILCSRLVA